MSNLPEIPLAQPAPLTDERLRQILPAARFAAVQDGPPPAELEALMVGSWAAIAEELLRYRDTFSRVRREVLASGMPSVIPFRPEDCA